MIDVHCHLEQKDYQEDRDEIVEKLKKELKAIITCCTHPADFDLTMEMVKKYKDFVFASVAIHPIYIKEITEKEVEDFLKKIEEKKDKIIAIGETGLDFKIEELEWQKKQRELFVKFIQFAKDLNLPLVIHSRKAYAESIEVLEQYGAKRVLMHFFTARKLLPKIIKNKWSISVNTALFSSKDIKKIVRDLPLEQIMTETDSPWLGFEGKRNDPSSVKSVIEKISEIKKVGIQEVKKITTQNAIKFFNLPI
jgi:TatD DNase family protein